VRGDRLNLNVSMRSNDVWRGLTYDGFQFCQLLITAARVLEIPVGRYHHMSWSLHIYETDVEAAERMLSVDPTAVTRPYQPSGVGRVGDSLAEVERRIRALAAGARVDEPTVSEGWFVEYLTAQLTPYVG
jgi:thymidylate synthase